ncbi:MAG: hypothetical protein JWP61_556 [Friedmanniella sp.]|nr:hypothetical protein [Friedmanniella sp.]
MTEHERAGVVVGVDGSPEALEAARFADREAAARGVRLTLAHAAELPLLDTPYDAVTLRACLERGRELVRHVAAQLPAAPHRQVHEVVKLESAVMLLLRLSAQAELVVLGHRHLGPLDKLLRGDIGGPVAAGAGCPVVVVPRGWTPWASEGQPVVLALDAESPARAALDVAFTTAERLQVELVVLHAAEPTVLQWVVDEDRVAVSTIIAGARLDHPDVVVREVRVEDDPGPALLAAARATSLLVVGRGRSATRLAPWTHSVAGKLLGQVHCPVAIVPPDPIPAGASFSGTSRAGGR